MKLVFPKIYSFPQYLLVGVFLLEHGSKVESFSSSGSGNFLTFTLRSETEAINCYNSE